MKTLILIGLGLALLFKGAGRLYATLHRIDPTGSKATVAQHFSLAVLLFGGALVFGLLVVAAFLVPPTWAIWALTVGLGLLILLNICLGGLAGTASSLGSFLTRPRRWDNIEYEVRMKERTRNLLGRFLIILITVGLVSADQPDPLAAEACGIAVDETASLDPAGRGEAISFIKATAFDYIDAMGCSWIVVSQFGSATRFSKRTWIETVKEPDWRSCDAAEPEPLTGHAALFKYARNVTIARQKEAVDACHARQAIVRRKYEGERAQFTQVFGHALSVKPKMELSRIADFVQDLAQSDLYRSLVLITDGMDNPPVPLGDIRIPEGLRVIMIIVPPDRKYADPERVLVRAHQWAAVPNVTVATVAELYPGFWESIHTDGTP